MITIKGFIGNAVSRSKHQEIEAYILFFRSSAKKFIEIDYGSWVDNYPYHNFMVQLAESRPLQLGEGEIYHGSYYSDSCELRSMFFIKAEYTEFDESYLYKALEDAVEYNFTTVSFQLPFVKKHEDFLAVKVLHAIHEFEKNHPEVTMTIWLSVDHEQIYAKDSLIAHKIKFS